MQSTSMHLYRKIDSVHVTTVYCMQLLQLTAHTTSLKTW